MLVAALMLVGLAVVFTGAPARAAGTAPESLRLSGLEQPADIDDLESPTFSWYVASARQTAYRVVVSSSAANAVEGVGDVWDSGRVDSEQQTGVVYEGSPLSPNQGYYWSVQTWDETGVASAFAAPAWFGTAPGDEWADSTPIWTDSTIPGHEQVTWEDYTATMSFTVTQTALGLLFRAPDDRNAFMYQFRANDNVIRPHTLINGQYAALQDIALPAGTLIPNQRTFVELSVEGATVTTKIGTSADALVEVDSREFDVAQLPATGTVGFRTGNSEAGYVHELAVRSTSDQELFDNDFSHDHGFPCGSVSNGAYNVGNGQACVYASGAIGTDWAFLRTEVAPADKEISRATLFATAGDFRAHKQYVYKAYVNGEFAGLGPTNRIHGEDRFDGFDVTGLLRAGEANAIGVIAYTAGEDRQRFVGQLRVDYTDGSSETFGTDEHWKALPGSLAYPAAGSIGTGYFSAPKENLDLREFPQGFDEPGFDDEAWSHAVAKPAFANLQSTPMAKVEEQLHAPVSIVEKGDGHYFIDFGRTWIGGVRYNISESTAGAQVDLRFGEVETAAGSQTVKYQMNTGNNYQDVVTLDSGEQTIETWGMRVFRYLEIIGAPEPVTAENLQALALVYPFDAEASSFDSSDDNLNQVYQLSKNSIEALNVNFFTDSWSRERTNYEADGYLQQMSSLYLMEDLSLARYSMNYFEGNRTWPTEWPLYVVLAVHDAWRQTGDLKQVEQYYDNLAEKMPTEWIDPQTGLVGKDWRSNGCNSQTDCDIVDWPGSQRDGYQFRHYNTVVNALSYRAMRDMAAMAEALGKADEAATYAAQAEKLRASMNELLYDDELGAYDDGMSATGEVSGHHAMHASAFSLAFGVPEADQAQRVADFTAGKGMACSVYCAGFSITGLIDGGRPDAAIDQLTAEGTSSWMNMIRRGAGATAEAWDESQKSNLTYSHPWAASPAFHVPSGIFGIRPVDAGYASFQIKPRPGSLDWASVTIPTVKGKIGTAFDHDDDGRLQTVAKVPGNTSADISIPVPEDTRRLYLDGVAHEVTADRGFATLEGVGAGCHLVTIDEGESALSNERLVSLCDPSGNFGDDDDEAGAEGDSTADDSEDADSTGNAEGTEDEDAGGDDGTEGAAGGGDSGGDRADGDSDPAGAGSPEGGPDSVEGGSDTSGGDPAGAADAEGAIEAEGTAEADSGGSDDSAGADEGTDADPAAQASAAGSAATNAGADGIPDGAGDSTEGAASTEADEDRGLLGETGAQAMPWIAGLGVLLLLAGAAATLRGRFSGASARKRHGGDTD